MRVILTSSGERYCDSVKIRNSLFFASDDVYKQVGGSLVKSVTLAKPEPQRFCFA